MKILIEEHDYAPDVLRGVLPEGRLLLTGGKYRVENVGYYHGAGAGGGTGDFVFFLPKVVMNAEGRVFATREHPGFTPEELVDPARARAADGRPLDARQTKFLYEFAVWIYRALAQFLAGHPSTGVVWRRRERSGGVCARRGEMATLLDAILALLRFARENRDYYLFRVKERHAGGGRIDWPRTVARTVPRVSSDGEVVYGDVRRRRREVDFDEELLVIFHSILAYVRRVYGFPVRLELEYELITGAAFERYLKGRGAVRLRQIRYRYFSDRDVALWELCRAFFERARCADASAGAGEDYLLAKDFEVVFEAMVDELIGDAALRRFRNLSDGKTIDHLYVDDGPVRRAGRALYVADSKYYRAGNALGAESVAKQFTYARNLVQLNLDLFLPEGLEAAATTRARRAAFAEAGVGLARDPVTEGYDVIPNFFVSAHLEEELSAEVSALNARSLDEGGEYLNLHYENRLFDRDTLILEHFDVNFLYVLRLYARNDAAEKESWRREVRGLFREKVRKQLEGHFAFYTLHPRPGVDVRAFLDAHFRALEGKVLSWPAAADAGTSRGRPDAAGREDVDAAGGAAGRVYVLALAKPENPFDDRNLSEAGKRARAARIRAENRAVLALLSDCGIMASSFNKEHYDT